MRRIRHSYLFRLLALCLVLLVSIPQSGQAQAERPSGSGYTYYFPIAFHTSVVSCAGLGSTWTSGRTRWTGSHYDVSDCTRPIPPTQAEMVKPAERNPERWAEARCNDGTPFGLEVELSSKPTSYDWVILLQGGSFCDDNAISCVGRGSLSTTPPEADRASLDLEDLDILKADPDFNPTFHQANHVHAYYCSSDGWSGATTTRRPTEADPDGWYFSGRANVEALLEVLMERYGLDDSHPQTQVLLGGLSAGGAGIQANADAMKTLLPQTAARGRLRLVVDAGVVIDFDNPDYPPGEATVPLRELFIQAYDFWGSHHNYLCEEAVLDNGQPPGTCFLGAINYPYATQPEPDGLGLPLLVQNSSIDEWSMNFSHINYYDPGDQAAVAEWRATTLQTLTDMNWVFSGGEEPYHTLLLGSEWHLGPSGSTFQEVLTRFWLDYPPERVIFGNP